ncbi:MAG: hypothetical protein HY791_02570 [Deltaproteobacteria bacterium]|nr:hypothetical protein [Deltaproteobacteria bacterium]
MTSRTLSSGPRLLCLLALTGAACGPGSFRRELPPLEPWHRSAVFLMETDGGALAHVIDVDDLSSLQFDVAEDSVVEALLYPFAVEQLGLLPGRSVLGLAGADEGRPVPTPERALVTDVLDSAWSAVDGSPFPLERLSLPMKPREHEPGAPAVRVAVGLQMSCVLRASGRVQCFGRNLDGQIGLPPSYREALRTVAELDDAVSLAASSTGVCAGLRNGLVWCWGSELASATKRTPVRKDGIRDVVALSAGRNHACAVSSNGAVFCWGLQDDGQVDGVPSVGRKRLEVPVEVDLPEPATQIALGEHHSCALLVSGTVLCWGLGHRGQLGNGIVAPDGQPPSRAVGLEGVELIAAGGDSTCARSTDATFCFGSNTYGQLDDSRAPTLEPRRVDIPRPGLWVGPRSICGGLGRATTCRGYFAAVDHPESLLGDLEVAEIAAGHDHACVLDQHGSVHCVGASAAGQLGYLADVSPEGVGEVEALRGADRLWVAPEATCGQVAGRIRCVGRSAVLGVGVYSDPVTPPIEADVTAAFIGDTHACAQTRTATAVQCLGQNESGQLGSRSHPSGGPFEIPQARRAVALRRTHQTSCAVLADGQLICWGPNDHGELGEGDDQPHDGPVVVRLPEPIVDVGIGGAHVCALARSGALYCWGEATPARGDNRAGVSRPALVPSLPELAGLAVGSNHTCGLTRDQRVLCFGGRGAFAYPDMSAKVEPVELPDTQPAAEVTAGPTATVVVKVDGTVLSFGVRETERIADLARTKQVQLGGSHICGLKDAKVLCRGSNDFGQLGRAPTGFRGELVLVELPDE